MTMDSWCWRMIGRPENENSERDAPATVWGETPAATLESESGRVSHFNKTTKEGFIARGFDHEVRVEEGGENIEHRTSNIAHRTSHIELPTSVFAKATPDKLKIEVDRMRSFPPGPVGSAVGVESGGDEGGMREEMEKWQWQLLGDS